MSAEATTAGSVAAPDGAATQGGAPPGTSARGWTSPLATGMVVLVAALVAFVFDTSLKEPYRPPKIWILAFSGWAALAVSWLLVPSPGLVWRRIRAAVIAVAPLLLVAAASRSYSVVPGLTNEALIALAGGVSLLVACVATPLRYRWLFTALQLLGMAVALWLFWDWLQMRAAPPRFRARFELRASLGNPADIAIFLLVPCLIVQQRLHRLWRGWKDVRAPTSVEDDEFESSPSTMRWFALGFAGLVLHAAVLLTQSLAGVAALAVGTLVLLPAARTWRGRFGIVVLGVLAGAAVLVSPAGPRAVQKLEQLRDGEYNRFLTGRLDGWIVAAELTRQRPWLGAGLGTYGVLYNAEKERLLDHGVEFFTGHELHSSFGNAHNELLEVAAELGIVGLAAVGWMVVVLLRRSFSMPRPRRRFALAVLAAMAVVSLSYFPFRTAATALPTLLVVAWILSSGDRSPLRAETPTPVSSGRRWIGGVVVALMLAMGWMVIASAVLPALRTERALWVAEARANTLGGVTSGPQKRTWEIARGSLESAFERRPYDARLPLAIGSYWMLAGNPQAARRWYLRSLEIEVRPETLLNLARVQRALGSEVEALRTEDRLIALDPYRRRELRPTGS